jgi:8-oxo-dGTP pyrophosphatase MutT (NUDIX family)
VGLVGRLGIQIPHEELKDDKIFYLCTMSVNSNISLIELIQRRLELPLPGSEAQWRMAASHRGNKSFDFNFNSPPVKSSVLIMLFNRDGKFHFPLIQRPDYGGVHGGQIGLPGGKEEPEDRDRIATSLRETSEEIGVDTTHVKILGILTELYVQASNYNVLPVIGYIPYVPQYQPDPLEVSDVIECSIDELLSDKIMRERELIIRNNIKIQAPYFEINHHIVWGATAMMLSEFKTILKEVNL